MKRKLLTLTLALLTLIAIVWTPQQVECQAVNTIPCSSCEHQARQMTEAHIAAESGQCPAAAGVLGFCQGNCPTCNFCVNMGEYFRDNCLN